MNVHTMLSYGDTPMCITMVKEQGPSCPHTNSWEKIDIEAKGDIHSCAKYFMTILKDKKAVARTQSHVKNPINLTLRLKVNFVLDL